MFLSYFLQTLADSDKSRYIVSWINLLQSTTNVYHLPLHYLVFIEIFMLENGNCVQIKSKWLLFSTYLLLLLRYMYF